jgi:hypothetical protein
MSSIKCVGVVAALGAAASGGMSVYNGMKNRKAAIAHAQSIADTNNGKIPTGGKSKDGKLWDGFTTVEEIKKKSGKAVAFGAALSAIAGGITTAVIAGITLLAKAKIK